MAMMSWLPDLSAEEAEPKEDKEATESAELTEEKKSALEVWRGLWVQEDSGGVMDFRADGKIIGVPVSGSFSFSEPKWIEIKSGPETLRCRWRARPDEPGTIELARFEEGKADIILVKRLQPAKLDLKKWKGRCVIRHMVASGKTATNRSVTLEETGHLRAVQGGFYMRLTEGANGGVLAYASGEEDETINVRLLSAGRHLVLFDRLENPRLFASCLFVDGPDDRYR